MTCRAIKADGQRCGTSLGLSEDTRLCRFHDPARKAEADAARRKAGVTASERRRARKALEARGRPEGMPRRLETMADAKKYASWATLAVTTGTIDVRTAREIASLLREFRGANTQAEQEQTISRLKAQLAELKGKRSS